MTVQRATGGFDNMNLAEFEIVTSESLHQPIKSDVFKWNTASDEELSQDINFLKQRHENPNGVAKNQIKSLVVSVRQKMGTVTK